MRSVSEHVVVDSWSCGGSISTSTSFAMRFSVAAKRSWFLGNHVGHHAELVAIGIGHHHP